MQQGTSAVSRVSVFRSPEYSVSPQFRSEVTESIAARYRMKIDALSASEQRISFSWRAPGQSVLLSPNAFVEMDFDVVIGGRNDFRGQMGPAIQRVSKEDIEDLGAATAAAFVDQDKRIAPPARICFGSGDCVSQALTSYQLVINGAALSQVRQNNWKWGLDRCWLGEKVFQKRFSQAGGAYDAYDRLPVSGICFQANDDNRGDGDKAVSAITADSGIQKRLKNFVNATIAFPDSPAADESDKRRVRIRWPVNGCGIFQPGSFVSDEMSGSCPLQQSALALPHINIATLDLLFDDLVPTIFRNLCTSGNGRDDIAAGGGTRAGISATLVADSAKLHLEYLRTGAFRRIPEQAELQVYRVNVHDATSSTIPEGQSVTVPAAVTRAGVGSLTKALSCVGVDRSGSLGCAAYSATNYLEASWNGVTTAQAPSYLYFTLQKSSKIFALQGEANGRAIGSQVTYAQSNARDGQDQAGCSMNYLSRNTMSSCAIADFSLEIQASLGSYTYAGSLAPHLKTRQELFRDHLRYCTPSYLDYGDIQQWRTHSGCLLLGCDIWLRGLTSDATSFPMVFNAKVKFQNERQYYTGAPDGGYDAGLAIQQDMVQGTPVMCCIYPKNALTIGASSAVLSSDNLSHATAMDLIQRGQ